MLNFVSDSRYKCWHGIGDVHRRIVVELRVRPVERGEEARYQAQLAQHHYLGALPQIGEAGNLARVVGGATERLLSRVEARRA